HIAINRAGEVIAERPIAVKDGPSIHECSITDDYVIVFDLPVTISLPTLAQGYNFPYRWNTAHPAATGPRRRVL
ncbi:MAG: carotenoid oxygenase family protein, partial [Miltoncostaeaceae bacterium]